MNYDINMMAFSLFVCAPCRIVSASCTGHRTSGTDASASVLMVSYKANVFNECAELKMVCWLEICGKIDNIILTPNVACASYLVFKLTDKAWGALSNPFQTTKITLAGILFEHLVCLNLRERKREPWWG
ncbi:F-box protein PP2-B15 [Carex littledalei]|uniref:F-box protein PP2-B15 n=1 Tax=Carex littledalei TaxID=544730 RepID=A0A833R2Z3_9POAL|nr:F-box protein PP2-B15 [Carex littledalei]